ncbi:MAG: DUF2431 domain-containing protein [Candidatus Nanoarchaeia archaeon]|nr:DUF2431 domain-containing protein [Candidatus Nanoarchaeia archaeon]MDD5741261.1 DUF2431 domain-containing protein [Candidatus Nanoarchaeia archaeon]
MKWYKQSTSGLSIFSANLNIVIIHYQNNMEIYSPSDDSYLLSETLKSYLKNKHKNIKILDMGSGSGIQAQTCKDSGFKNVLCADINSEAIKHLKKQGFNSIKSNLFLNIDKKNKFDLIIFNPPYLPEDEKEPEDSKINTTAGKRGYEIVLKFLKQAKSHLNNNGSILLLFSSFSQPAIIKKQAEDSGYKIKEVSDKKLFFEELFVYEFRI